MGPHMGSVVTMIGPCLTQLYFQTNLSLETLNTETNRLKVMSRECLVYGSIRGPYLDMNWPC